MSLDNLDGQITPNDLIDLGIATRDSRGRLSSGGSISLVAAGAPHDGTSDAATIIEQVFDEAAAQAVSSGLPVTVDGGGHEFTVASTITHWKDYVQLQNMRLKLADGSGIIPVLTNYDHSGGNVGLRARNVVIDGNKGNQAGTADSGNPVYGVRLHRCSDFLLSDFTVKSFKGTGLFATGGDDAGTPVQTRVGAYYRVYAHDCDLDGIWTGNAMREIFYGGVFGRLNGGRGVVIDHSEAISSAVHAYGNTGRGIWVRNVHGCQLHGLSAKLNGDHGIWVLGMTYSEGSGWSAFSNGQLGNGSGSEGYYDVFFDDTNIGYDSTNNTKIDGIVAGYDQFMDATARTASAVYFADGLAGKDLKVTGILPTGSVSTGVRVPATSTTLYVSGYKLGEQKPTVWAGADDAPVLKTTNYSMAVTDRVVYAQTGGITISLPDPTTTSTGRRFTVKNTSAGYVAVNSQGSSKTIEGRTLVNLVSGGYMTVESNGVEWKLIAGRIAPVTLTKTANYNMVVTDDVVIGNGASITISLPGPGNCAPGHRYIVKNINSSSLTVNSQGTSKTIDGAASVTLAQWASLVVFTDGSAWYSV